MSLSTWLQPIRQDLNHRENSFKCALLMLEKPDELLPVFLERGYPDVVGGIGINSVIMNVGDMGSIYRRSYTVLGDSVILSSRLEGLAKLYGIQLLAGDTAERARYSVV